MTSSHTKFTEREEYRSLDSWGKAQLIASLVGTMPPFFTSCARYLVNEAAKTSGLPSDGTRYVVSQLWRSPTLRATFAYTVKEFFPERLNALGKLTDRELTSFLEVDDLAALLCLRYLFKRIQKGCEPDLHPELALRLHRDLLFGGLLGQAIPGFGVTRGIILAGFQNLGFQMLLGVDLDGFRTYRRTLRTREVPYDFTLEMDTWGCTHVQIASLLIQQVGLGVNVANSLQCGLHASYSGFDELDSDSRAFLIGKIWIESLAQTADQPPIVHRTEYYPNSTEFERVVLAARALQAGKTPLPLLQLSAEDVTPERAPFLYTGQQHDRVDPTLDGAAPDVLANLGEIPVVDF